MDKMLEFPSLMYANLIVYFQKEKKQKYLNVKSDAVQTRRKVLKDIKEMLKVN